MADDEKIRQEASGIGNVQASNNSQAWSFVNIIGEFPLEKIIFAELLAVIAVQILIVLIGAAIPFSTFALFLYFPLCLCSPFVFGPNAIYALTIGVAKKDSKIIVLSIISLLLIASLLCINSIIGSIYQAVMNS
jgi:hypothetical protein